MGIPTLFEEVKPFTRTIQTKSLKGRKVGIDASYLFHWVGDGTVEERAARINSRLSSLIADYGFVIHVVFDGEDSPGKKSSSARDDVRQRVRQVMMGVTNHMRVHGAFYFVAPHEADHQLVHFYRVGMIDYILCNDADLVLHAEVRVIRFTTLDATTCEVIDLKTALSQLPSLRPIQGTPTDITIAGFLRSRQNPTEKRFDSSWSDPKKAEGLDCVLAAFAVFNCDYLEFPGLGPATICKIIDAASAKPFTTALLAKTAKKTDSTWYHLFAGYDEAVLVKMLKTALDRLAHGFILTLPHGNIAPLLFKPSIVDTAQMKLEEIMSIVGDRLEIPAHFAMVPARRLDRALFQICAYSWCEWCTRSPPQPHPLAPITALYLPGSEPLPVLELYMATVHANKFTVAQLNESTLNVKTFLESRRYTITESSESTAARRERAIKLLKSETRPGFIVPEAFSRGCHLVFALDVLHANFANEMGEIEMQKLRESPGWDLELSSIVRMAPTCDDDVIERFFAQETAGVIDPWDSAALDRGLCHAQMLPTIEGLGLLLPSPHNSLKPLEVAFRFELPPSYSHNTTRFSGDVDFATHVVVLVVSILATGVATAAAPTASTSTSASNDSGAPSSDGVIRSLGKADSIVKAGCSCKHGVKGRCAHVAALAMIASTLPNADASKEPSCTSLRCVWAQALRNGTTLEADKLGVARRIAINKPKRNRKRDFGVCAPRDDYTIKNAKMRESLANAAASYSIIRGKEGFRNRLRQAVHSLEQNNHPRLFVGRREGLHPRLKATLVPPEEENREEEV